MASVLKFLTDHVNKITQNYQGSLQNLVSTLFVLALQELVAATDIFQCPLEGYKAYGCAFIFLPALILFMISLLLSESFRKAIQGCCYIGKGVQKRWRSSEKLLTVLFYSLVAGCLWIFWALLQKKYYTCAEVGSIEQLKTAKGDNKTRLEKRFKKARTDSQIYGFVFIALIIGIPLLFQSLRRCLCLRPYTSIPSLAEYEDMEAEAAEKELKVKLEKHAKDQGKANAGNYFSHNIKECQPKKSIHDIISEAHREFSKIEGYEEAMKNLGDNLEGKALAEKTKEKIAELAGKEVTSTFDGKAVQKCENKKPCEFMPKMSKAINNKFGDQCKPVENDGEKKKGSEMVSSF